MFIKINKIVLHVSKSLTITTQLLINTCMKYVVIFMKMLFESKLLRIQMLIKINQPIKLKKKRFKNQCSPTNALLVVAGQAFSSNFKGIALSISAIYH